MQTKQLSLKACKMCLDWGENLTKYTFEDLRECMRLFGLRNVRVICGDDLLKFMSDVMVEKKIKDVKCIYKFTLVF